MVDRREEALAVLARLSAQNRHHISPSSRSIAASPDGHTWAEPPPPPPDPASSPMIPSPPPPARGSRPLNKAALAIAAGVAVAGGLLAGLLTSSSGRGHVDFQPASARGSAATAPATTAPPTSAATTTAPTTPPTSRQTTPPTTAAAAAAVSPVGAPRLTALSPARGSAGQTIAVHGLNLVSATGTITVMFGGVVASVGCPTQTTCLVTVPPQPGPSGAVPITLATSNGQSNPLKFLYGSGSPAPPRKKG